MSRCWVLYDRTDLERNAFFAGRLVEEGRRLGMDTEVVLTEDATRLDAPDIVVSRMRDWKLSDALSRGGATVVNCTEVCRICNDKALTYDLLAEEGIPHLPYSMPGDGLPPGPPWVVKTRDGHGGSGVRMAHDGSEVEGMMLAPGAEGSIVQQVAPVLGRDMRVYVLGGEMIATVMRSSDSDFRANHSLGGRAELCEPPDGAMDIVDRIVDRLDPDFVGIDFLFGENTVYVNEIEDVVGTRMLYELTCLDPARLLMEHVYSKTSL